MVFLGKGRRIAFGGLAILIGLSLSVTPAFGDGNYLRTFDAPKVLPLHAAQYFPIGITSDGNNLYYSQPSSSDEAIFHVTSTGVLINTLTSVPHAGALTWDGGNLWVGTFGSKTAGCSSGVGGCALLFKVNPKTGDIIQTVDVSAIFAADQECGDIDGLSFDVATGSLWVSPDVGCAIAFTNNICSIGFAYNVDTSGNLIQRIQFSFGVSGVAVANSRLYVVDRCPKPSVNFIAQVDKNGNVVSGFPIVNIDPGNWAEAIAFDQTSFSPNCALWAVQPYSIPNTVFAADIVAYQIGCP